MVQFSSKPDSNPVEYGILAYVTFVSRAAFTAAYALILPAPRRPLKAEFAERVVTSKAVDFKIDSTSSGVRLGFSDRINAQRPATIGEANEVPQTDVYESFKVAVLTV